MCVSVQDEVADKFLINFFFSGDAKRGRCEGDFALNHSNHFSKKNSKFTLQKYYFKKIESIAEYVMKFKFCLKKVFAY